MILVLANSDDRGLYPSMHYPPTMNRFYPFDNIIEKTNLLRVAELVHNYW